MKENVGRNKDVFVISYKEQGMRIYFWWTENKRERYEGDY